MARETGNARCLALWWERALSLLQEAIADDRWGGFFAARRSSRGQKEKELGIGGRRASQSEEITGVKGPGGDKRPRCRQGDLGEFLVVKTRGVMEGQAEGPGRCQVQEAPALVRRRWDYHLKAVRDRPSPA